jgi:glycosyltransferase involved in cell wall biosynthesis
MAPAISVIVPTKAIARRTHLLRRALGSIIDQARVNAQAIVVVNGPERDQDLVEELRGLPGVTLLFREEPELRGALHAGLERVTTPFVSSLDDDDFLLPGALAHRHEALIQEARLDVVVTNGFNRTNGEDVINTSNSEDVCRDPLRALFDNNWLLPGSWLARTHSVSPWLYWDMPNYLECTYLALRFAHDLRMKFLAEPTVVHSMNSPDSVFGSLAFRQGQIAALNSLIKLSVAPEIGRRLRDRFRIVWHEMADTSLYAGELSDAFRYHVRTLRSPGGWRHLPFARHLVRAALRGGKSLNARQAHRPRH